MEIKKVFKYYEGVEKEFKESFPSFHPVRPNQTSIILELNKVFEHLDDELKKYTQANGNVRNSDQEDKDIQRICKEAIVFSYGLLYLEPDDKSPAVLKLFSKMTASYGFLYSYEEVLSADDSKNHSHTKNYSYYIERLKKDSEIGDGLKIALFSGLLKFFNLIGTNNTALIANKYLLCICYTDRIDKNDDVKIAFANHLYGYLKDFCIERVDLIGKLNKYFSWLSNKTAELVLVQYPPEVVATDVKVRHQIFKLIESRSWQDDIHLTSDQDISYNEYNTKSRIKFMYLDNKILMVFCKENWCHTEDDIQLFIFSNDTGDACWSVDRKDNYQTTWIFDDYHSARIALETEKKEILMDCNGRHYCFSFSLNDYILEHYTRNNLKILFDSEISPEKGGFAFSLVSLQNYREPNDHYELNFDNAFKLHKAEDGKVYVTKENEKARYHTWLYGNKIYSVNCIVGKNGTGKTSIIDFLRDAFFSLVDQFEMECLNGETAEKVLNANVLRKIGLLESFKFLVIFKIQDMSYLFTNYDGDFVKKELQAGLNLYDANAYLKYGSLYQYTSVAYFSGKLDYFKLNDENVKNTHYREITSDNSEEHIVKEYLKEKSNTEGVPTVDSPLLSARLSMAVFFKKILSMNYVEDEGEENTNNKHDVFFEMKPRIEKIRIIGEKGQYEEANVSVSQQMEDYIKNQVSKKKFAHFSSGEYSFFSFFSRLYWFFGGWKDAEELKGKKREDLTEADRPRNSTGSAGNHETVVLCIDEGDLYFHPEWERKFVDYMLTIIDESDIECSVQIIITTNSPFMLSDIMHEDVQYLFDEDESEENQQRKKEVLLFGQNIHTLLSNTFFLTSTIGEFSLNKIGKMYDVLANVVNNRYDKEADSQKVRMKFCDMVRKELFVNVDSPDDAEAFVSWFIAHVGEPVYSRDLHRMYEQYVVLSGQKNQKKQEEIEQLKQLINARDELDAQIQKLSTEVLT